MSLTPAYDALEEKKKRDSVEKCGKNMGPHDFMIIETKVSDSHQRVTRLMCKVCFCNLSIEMLLKHYPEVSL